MNRRTALILAGDSDGNLGDFAILAATVAAMREIDPSVDIAAVSGRPERDRERLGIATIPRGPAGSRALFNAARRARLVLCGGGGLFQDDDSRVKMPYWGLRLATIRTLCRRLAGFSIGAGPLHHASSRSFARLALRSMNSVSVRDAFARATLAPLTPKTVNLVPDPAFMLAAAPEGDAAGTLRAHGIPDDGRPLIGVAMKRSFHTQSNLIPHKYAVKYALRRVPGAVRMRRLVELSARALDAVAERIGAHIVFLPTYTVPHENDEDVCRAVGRLLKTPNHCIVLDDPSLYKSVCARLSLMLAGRMHAGILAASAGTPVVGMSYNPKFRGSFELLGMENRCLSQATLVADSDHDTLTRTMLAALEDDDPRNRADALSRNTRGYLERLIREA